jgi:hypothetical protein
MVLDGGEETLRTLTSPFTIQNDVLELYWFAAFNLGRKYYDRDVRMPWYSHVSVSTSSTFDVVSEAGGRAEDVSTSVRLWLGTLDLSTLPEGTYYDCFGQLVFWKEGEAFHPLVNLEDEVVALIDYMPDLFGIEHAFYPYHTDPLEIIGMLQDGDDIPDELINQKLGLLVLLWSVTMLNERGSWEIEPDITWGDMPLWNSEVANTFIPNNLLGPRCRFKSLSEPGLKVRPLTISEAWSTELFQFLRFLMEPVFHKEQRARVGFETDNKLWEFIKVLNHEYKDETRKRKFLVDEKGNSLWFMNSDYKSATDYLTLDLIRSIWNGFLEGFKIPKQSPVWVLRHMLSVPRRFFPSKDTLCLFERLGLQPGVTQTRGSLMGEPMSFLTLTLYNLCNLDITETALRTKGGLQTLLGSPQLMSGHTSHERISQVVGDDVLALAPKRFIEIFYEIVAISGMHLSKGKDLPSQTLMILCEDHTFVDRTGAEEESSSDIIGADKVTITKIGKSVVHYLDVVKIRLLVGSGRIYKDHRAAMIGKAAMLSNQTAWHPNKVVARMSHDIYRHDFEEMHGKSLFIRKLPYELPANAGGFSLPRLSWSRFEEEFPRELRFLRWLLNLPASEFLGWHLMMRKPSDRRARGIETKTDFDYMLRILSTFDHCPKGDELNAFNDQRGRTLYDYRQVISLVEQSGADIPKSIWSGNPIHNLLREQAKDLGLLPLGDVVATIERISSMEALFSGDLKKSSKSFVKLQRDLFKFWRRKANPHLTSDELPLEHGFRGFSDIAKSFGIKAGLWVQNIEPISRFVGEGPHMRIRLHRYNLRR